MGIITLIKNKLLPNAENPVIPLNQSNAPINSPDSLSQSQKMPDEDTSSFEEIGNTEPICPYCEAILENMPKRKISCPKCTASIYVRTRPADKRQVLVRENQISEIAEQWAIANGTHEQFVSERNSYEAVKRSLQGQFGKEPTEQEIRWASLNGALLNSYREAQWGLYRNARFSMGEILRKDSKYLEALDTFLEVCYFDLGGFDNSGNIRSHSDFASQILSGTPLKPRPFFLAPRVISYIRSLMKKLNLSVEQTRDKFIRVSLSTEQKLKLKSSGEGGWKQLEQALVSNVPGKDKRMTLIDPKSRVHKSKWQNGNT